MTPPPPPPRPIKRRKMRNEWFYLGWKPNGKINFRRVFKQFYYYPRWCWHRVGRVAMVIDVGVLGFGFIHSFIHHLSHSSRLICPPLDLRIFFIDQFSILWLCYNLDHSASSLSRIAFAERSVQMLDNKVGIDTGLDKQWLPYILYDRQHKVKIVMRFLFWTY